MIYWKTPHLREPLLAHAMEGSRGTMTLCGTFMSIYRAVQRTDERCPSCTDYLQNYSRNRAREAGHVIHDDDTESSVVTRMIVEGWMGKPHYDYGPEHRCRCLGIFPKFLGPETIVVGWDGVISQEGAPPLAFCGYHAVGITCEACPQCVRCRRRMTRDLGHLVCEPYRANS